jgi:SAM-dependent methyltransferase
MPARLKLDGVARTTLLRAAAKARLTPEAIATRIPIPPARPGALTLNRFCRPDSWEDPLWRTVGRALGLQQEEGYYHRKAWEWVQCVYGLERLGALGPDKTALGVGAGHECVIYYLANRTRLTVATDLYSGGFVTAHAAEADPEFLRDPDAFAPFRYHRDALRALPADGCLLPFPHQSFDVVWSLSSIEHFGGHDRAADAMREIARVLRPGGVACIATELILDGPPNGEYFTPRELEEWVIQPSGLVPVEPLDDRWPPREYLDDPVRLPDEYLRTPHIVLAIGEMRFTSVIVFLRKPMVHELVRWAPARVVDSTRRVVARRRASSRPGRAVASSQ